MQLYPLLPLTPWRAVARGLTIPFHVGNCNLYPCGAATTEKHAIVPPRCSLLPLRFFFYQSVLLGFLLFLYVAGVSRGGGYRRVYMESAAAAVVVDDD